MYNGWEVVVCPFGLPCLLYRKFIFSEGTCFIGSDCRNNTDSLNIATPVETLPTGYLVTAADKAPGKDLIIMLGYQSSGFGTHYLTLLTGYSKGKFFNGNKQKIKLPNALVMGQAEGITFRNDTYGYISNEKFFAINQRIRSFNISGYLTGSSFKKSKKKSKKS